METYLVAADYFVFSVCLIIYPKAYYNMYLQVVRQE